MKLGPSARVVRWNGTVVRRSGARVLQYQSTFKYSMAAAEGRSKSAYRHLTGFRRLTCDPGKREQVSERRTARTARANDQRVHTLE